MSCAQNAEEAVTLIRAFQNRNLSIEKKNCLSFRNRNCGCTRCADACPAQCIRIDEADGSVTFHMDDCLACGTCATACPAGALAFNHPGDTELKARCLAAAQAAEGRLVVLCEPLMNKVKDLVDAEKVVYVPCLGRFDESLLAELLEEGVERITLVKGPCDDCQMIPSLRLAEQVVENLAALRGAWGLEPCMSIAGKIPGAIRAIQRSFDKTRRGFFDEMREAMRTAGEIGANAAIDKALDIEEPVEEKMHVTEKGTLPQALPHRQFSLIRNMATHGLPDRDAKVEGRLWGQARIDPDRCTSCLMCATFCPTGSISRMQRADGTLGITIQPATCIQCRTCENICSGKAITVGDEVRALYLVKGTKANFKMKGRGIEYNKPDTATMTMRKVLGIANVYDR